MTVLAYNYRSDPEDASLIILNGTLAKSEEVIEVLRDADANVDVVDINDGDYVEVIYNRDTMNIRKTSSPESILEDLTEIAKEQWSNDSVYFEDLGGTELSPEDYDSPEALAKAAYDNYYITPEKNAQDMYDTYYTSSDRREIFRFNSSDFPGARQWLHENGYDSH